VIGRVERRDHAIEDPSAGFFKRGLDDGARR
jgi:hypothetical protein